jgi:hypothetical protein
MSGGGQGRGIITASLTRSFWRGKNGTNRERAMDGRSHDV